MSKSPTQTADTSSLLRYQQGWRALNRLLHTDRSFSGHERNCAFLNLGQGEFASVSAIAGLDYPDDGRAVATCDWDFDGQLDLWCSARTAPRLRFVHNQQPTENHFVALYLQGNGSTTNRNAIGARVELHLPDETARKYMKTRHAGEGFLSQSSGWLHFGLGRHTNIDHVVVHWPAGERESFRGISADSFLILEQGTGEVSTWTPPASRRTLVAGRTSVPSSSDVARLVLPFRLPLPRLQVDWRGQKPPAGIVETHNSITINAPTIVSVWSSSCTNCLAELADWTQHQESFAQSGLNVIALNADSESDGSTATEVLDRIKFPFPWAIANSIAVGNLDLFQRAVVDRWRPMPVPCSFLVDSNGCVVTIYKGPVSVAQVLRDLDVMEASPEEIRAASTPFPGRWISGIPMPDPLRVSSQMVDHAQVFEAIAYLENFIRTAPAQASPARLADIHYILSVLLESQDQNERAAVILSAGRRLSPRDFRIRSALGRLLGELGRPDEASIELAEALRLNPTAAKVREQMAVALIQDDRSADAIPHLSTLLAQTRKNATAHFLMAGCQAKVGNWPAAVEHYRAVVRIDRTILLAANNLAHVLAAHPDENIRNVKDAMRLAQYACRQTKNNNPQFLDTLAVAYAANGEFEKAIESSQRAITLWHQRPGVSAQVASDQVKQIQARVELFEQKKPFRENW